MIKIEIPTVFGKDEEVVRAAVEKHHPDAVLCVGQAGGRSGITVEKVAINLMEARIPDNEGKQPLDTPIREDGENAYFASLPVKSMVQYMNCLLYTSHGKRKSVDISFKRIRKRCGDPDRRIYIIALSDI